MSVFSLTSDNQFITPSETDEDVTVWLYDGDTSDFKIIRATPWSNDDWIHGVHVGPTAENWKALELFGTTLEGERFKELVNELRAIEDDGGIRIFVNRLGLCIICLVNLIPQQAIGINDYFGWSKYGVEVPLDLRGIVGSETEEDIQELRQSLEAKEMELAACKKELEEKSVELKECNEVLERRKEESVLLSSKVEEAIEELRRSLEEKTVELTVCKEGSVLLSKNTEEANKIVDLKQCKEELERCKKMGELQKMMCGCLMENSIKLRECKKELEEKMSDEIKECNEELEHSKKGLEEKNVELAACKWLLEKKTLELAACKEELKENSAELEEWKEEMERIKKKESLLLSKRVEEATMELRLSLEEKAAELKECKEELERGTKKELVLLSKKVEAVNNLTQAFNSALRYLDDH